MSTASNKSDILIRIDTIDQLFNAPTSDPFSDKPAVILGEAALPYAVRQEVSRGLRGLRGRRLVIQLPADQINPGLQAQVANGLRRFAAAKKEENRTLIRISRWRSLAGLGFAFTVVAVLFVVTGIVLNLFFTSTSDTVTSLVVGAVTIFAWATIWPPWERLVYEWVEPAMQNRVLHAITEMEIVIQAEC